MNVTRVSGDLRGFAGHEIWIVDGVLRHKAPVGYDNGGYGNIREIRGYAYPGLVDCHTHPGVTHTDVLPNDTEVLRRLEASRRVGVTHIREMGAQRDVAEFASLGRTKVLRAGRHIARYKRYLPHMAVEVEPRDLADEAARQARRGDGWIKIVGDWIDRSEGADSDLRPLWPCEALIDAVAAAHESGAKVAVHTFARETIDDLLVAGVDSIEHGTGMMREHMAEAAARGILVDPTVRQVGTFREIAARAGKYPVYRARMLAMSARRSEWLRELVEAGTHFVMGSDTSGNVSERGLDVELQWAVSDGMPADVAMAAASYKGREQLGLPAWDDGAAADLVIYADDPERDIAVTSRPAHVFVDGRERADE